MNIILNGEQKTVENGASVAALLEGLSLDARKVAVERNREIIPKSQYAETLLGDGDALEIVHFIGGGAQ